MMPCIAPTTTTPTPAPITPARISLEEAAPVGAVLATAAEAPLAADEALLATAAVPVPFGRSEVGIAEDIFAPTALVADA